jgi:hypothetical protein
MFIGELSGFFSAKFGAELRYAWPASQMPPTTAGTLRAI